jgi:hypothetical protein
VRFDGDRGRFLKAHADLGCQAEELDPAPVGNTGGELCVQGPPGKTSELIFRSAHASQTSVRQLAPVRNSLEDIFLKAVQDHAGGEAAHADL